MRDVPRNGAFNDTETAMDRLSQTSELNIDAPRAIDSDALFKGERELRILHAGACYRLTITKLNKLILTK
ncbi:hemin uptake protein HemP [Breoghania sp.]|uniref:hemin uptake protein HemP n=1 Tax=Breoghania sp. TaxID=2065378 RepID=UPI002AA7005E|nr:hemin uptake protein HemP [Breoghania sp.]